MDLKILTLSNSKMFDYNKVYTVYLLQVGEKKLSIIKHLKEMYNMSTSSIQQLSNSVNTCSLSNPIRIDGGDGMKLQPISGMLEDGAIFGIAQEVDKVKETPMPKYEDPHLTQAGIMEYKDPDITLNALFKF